MNIRADFSGFSVARDKIVFTLADRTANIGMVPLIEE